MSRPDPALVGQALLHAQNRFNDEFHGRVKTWGGRVEFRNHTPVLVNVGFSAVDADTRPSTHQSILLGYTLERLAVLERGGG